MNLIDFESIISLTLEEKNEEVFSLLENFSVLNGRNKEGKTLLGAAAEKGSLSLVRKIVEKGADLNFRSLEYKETPLMIAAQEGKLEIVKFLISKGAVIHGALTRAAHKEIIDLLLDSGADIDEKDLDAGDTPLIMAAYGGHLEIINYLLEKGAGIDIKNENSEITAICAAGAKGNIPIVQELINRGANLHGLLSQAAYFGYPEIVKLALENGADVNERDKENLVPLIHATSRKGNGENLEILKILFDYDVDIDLEAPATGYEASVGFAAIFQAIHYDEYEIEKFLLEKGVEIVMRVDNRDVYYKRVEQKN